MNLLTLPPVFAHPRRQALMLVVALGVFQGICLLVAVYATRGLFSGLHHGYSIDWRLLALLGIVASLVPVLQALGRVRAEALSQSYSIDLRESTLDAIARLPPEVRARRSLGGLSLRFVGDMSAARRWVGSGLTQLISASILLPVAVFCLWWLHPSLALAGLGLLIPAILTVLVSGRGLREQQRILRKKRAKIAIRAINRLGIVGNLFIQGRLGREKKQLRKQGEAVGYEAVARIKRVQLLRTLPEIAMGLGGALIMLQAYRHNIPASAAAAALAVLAIVGLSLRQIVDVWDKYTAWNVALDRYSALFKQATLEEPRELTRQAALVEVTRDENIWTAAPGSLTSYTGFGIDEQKALWDSFTGESSHYGWTAETTLQNRCLPRVSLVSDNVITLPGSLRRALAFGCRKRPDDDKILLTARRIGLTQLLNRLGGLDGKVRENATDLTPSERLRVSICQALLAQPSIILIHSHVWQHLSDAAVLLAAVREQNATIIHNLPDTIATDSVIWKCKGVRFIDRALRIDSCA